MDVKTIPVLGKAVKPRQNQPTYPRRAVSCLPLEDIQLVVLTRFLSLVSPPYFI